MTRTPIETHISQSIVHWTCSNPSTTSPSIGSSILALPFRFPGRRMCQPTSSKRQSDDMSNQAQRACYPVTHTSNLYTCRTQGAQPHALSLPPGLFQKLDSSFSAHRKTLLGALSLRFRDRRNAVSSQVRRERTFTFPST